MDRNLRTRVKKARASGRATIHAVDDETVAEPGNGTGSSGGNTGYSSKAHAPVRAMSSTAAFSTVNLREVENSAEKFGLPKGFEARFAKSHLAARDLGLSLQRVAPGETSPFAHRHPEQPEELYLVVAGSGTATVDGVTQALATWDVIHVPGPAVRSFAAGEDGLEYVAFGRIHPADAELIELDAEA
jgi:quercetin dioxygenase-like cupin family protein